jgi:hypothetical protein
MSFDENVTINNLLIKPPRTPSHGSTLTDD